MVVTFDNSDNLAERSPELGIALFDSAFDEGSA
jgi:hypothetical protein